MHRRSTPSGDNRVTLSQAVDRHGAHQSICARFKGGPKYPYGVERWALRPQFALGRRWDRTTLKKSKRAPRRKPTARDRCCAPLQLFCLLFRITRRDLSQRIRPDFDRPFSHSSNFRRITSNNSSQRRILQHRHNSYKLTPGSSAVTAVSRFSTRTDSHPLCDRPAFSPADLNTCASQGLLESALRHQVRQFTAEVGEPATSPKAYV